ncbi:MAG: thioesterase family protein [Polaromonas sp.]|jgi:4-hydroxybenzoyl-CoA thioesterase|nr:thioesterase family protein [Polaromonas sp.]
MIFTTQKQVRFHHCDPAGIVFYPQFLYLLHEVQEDFLLHIGFAQHTLIAGDHGLPIVDLKTKFLGMCRYGDELTMTLALTRIGHASIGMHYQIFGRPSAPGQTPPLRLSARSVVVYATLSSSQPARIPDDLRSALAPYLQNTPGNK